MKPLRKAIFSLLMVICMVVPSFAGSLTMTVVHVNDTHSKLDPSGDKLKFGGKKTYVKLGGWARLKTKVDTLRMERSNVLLLHGGDAVQGTLYFTKFGGKPEMELMNLLDFDAMVLGNHEFDKGPDFLNSFLQYARFPVLSSNADFAKAAGLAMQVKPYTIIDMDGEKVGVIGLTLADTSVISSPDPVTFGDEIATCQQYVDELEARGVDKIIALTHMGLDADRELAASVKGLDMVVGGHSHSLMGNSDAMKAAGKLVEDGYPVMIKGVDGHMVPVVSSWEWAKAVGIVEVVFDAKGVITKASGDAVMLLADSFRRKNKEGRKVRVEGDERKEIDTIIAASPVMELVGEDTAVLDMLAPYTRGVDEMRNEVIGQAAADLLHIRVPGTHNSGAMLERGSLIAPLVCQAMLDKARSVGMKADLALQNAGGVRIDVPKGDITVGTAYTLMPFGNTLYVMDLTGSELKETLENGATRGSGAFAYLAGARYTVDPKRAEGDRVVMVEILKDGQYVPVDDKATYRIVTNAYIASGGDNYQVLEKASGYRYDTGFVDAAVFMDFVRKAKVLNAPKETGVIVLK